MKTQILGSALIALLALTGCDGNSAPSRTEQASDTENYMFDVAPSPEMAEESRVAGLERDQADASSDPALQQYIAYSYNFQLQYTAASVEPAMDAHRATCMAAGANICQVVASSASERNADYSQAHLQIRATPDWLRTFLGGLEEEVTGQGGDIVSSSMSSTDLSRPILDAEARLSAQRALRERLTLLLAREDAEIDDLVALERELARVQGNIEAAESNLRNMRGRVTLSTVDLRYSTRATVTSGGATNPVVHALRDIVRNVSTGLSAVITFTALFAPWLILIIPAIWLIGRWRRRVNARKRAEKAGG